MRTNLKVPFAEKDEAKALGARWDPTRKCWYVQDKDLSAFERWLADGPASAAPAAAAAPRAAPRTGPAQPPVHCGCDALPWEPCIHTRPAA